MLSEVCHPGHVQNVSQGLPGFFSFNWVDQWMMTRLNGFNLGGSASAALMAEVREVEQDRMAPPSGGRGARGGGQDGRVEQRASDWMAAAAAPLPGIPDPYSSP